MLQRICNHGAVLVLGIAVGLVLTAAWNGVGQPTAVQATATQGMDNYSIATGFVDDQLEGLYFLDFLTGDLRAAVLSKRTGRFEGFFEYNVQADFGAAVKNPKYLMVTGEANLPRGRGPTQLASGVIYVAEATSGQVFVYALPFSTSENNAGRKQYGSFQRLDSAAFRTTFVRDQ